MLSSHIFSITVGAVLGVLAGLAAGIWSGPQEIAQNRRLEQVFAPKMPQEQAQQYLRQWHRAVSRSLKWEE